MSHYPIVRTRYVDSAVRDRQTDERHTLEPIISEVAGFLVLESTKSVRIAREVFVEGKFIEVRGELCIPRCAIVGKIERLTT